MLTAEQQRVRAFKTTASQAPIIMSGDTDKILRLWQERIGEAEPEDLSDSWPVQLGSYLESFVLDWHERKTGMELTDRGTFYVHPEYSGIGATLDCYRPIDDAVIDAKVCSHWQPLDDITAYYCPQIIVQMRCRAAAHGALLIVHGGSAPQEIPIIPDADYETILWQRLLAFELCVQTLTPPAPLPAIVPPEQWRTIDLAAADPWPNWGPQIALDLERWRELKPSANEFEEISTTIKELIPADVGSVSYNGMVVKRNRRNAITIKDMNK
jgi:hypothetical protein